VHLFTTAVGLRRVLQVGTIGMWNGVLRVLARITMITNAGLVSD